MSPIEGTNICEHLGGNRRTTRSLKQLSLFWYIKALDTCDLSTLLSKEKHWKRRHLRNIGKYEILKTVVVV